MMELTVVRKTPVIDHRRMSLSSMIKRTSLMSQTFSRDYDMAPIVCLPIMTRP